MNEVDFAVATDDRLLLLAEVKESEGAPTPALRYFAERLQPQRCCLQLVRKLKRERHHGPIHVVAAAPHLAALDA